MQALFLYSRPVILALQDKSKDKRVFKALFMVHQIERKYQIERLAREV